MSKNKENELVDKEKFLQPNPVFRFLGRLLDHRILNQLELLIKRANDLGLPKTDVENALVNVEYREFELAFEVVVEQIYEYQINIDKEFYDLSMSVCNTLKINKQKYKFLRELIKE